MLRRLPLLVLCLALLAATSTADESGTATAAATITNEELKIYVFKLASDEMQGRKPGTDGYRMAAEFTEEVLREVGIKPLITDQDGRLSYRQPFAIERGEQKILTYNVVGILPGTDRELKDEYVTIGVHLDHIGVINGEIYNGADDNAASCAALLEVAEALVQAPTRRSVIIMFYSAEEMGLIGSRYFVDNPPVPLEQMVVNINMEMIGRHDTMNPDGFGFIGPEALSPELPDIITAVNEKYLNYPLLFMSRSEDKFNYFRRSDHFNFHMNGIPAIIFGGSMHADYHKPTDDPEKIVIEKVNKAAKLCFYLIQEFGNRDARPSVPARR